jgi:hypothetical protein
VKTRGKESRNSVEKAHAKLHELELAFKTWRATQDEKHVDHETLDQWIITLGKARHHAAFTVRERKSLEESAKK